MVNLLRYMMLVECEKYYEDIDADSVSECVDFLLELQGIEINKEKVDKDRDKVIDLIKS